MRFSVVTFLTTALAGTALGAVHQRSLITEIGNVIGQITEGLNVTEVEGSLHPLLGDALPKLEDALGIPFAEKLLGISDESANPGLIQHIGQGIAMLLQGVGIDEVEKWLDGVTGGAVSSLSDVLGVSDVLAALGIEPAEGASATGASATGAQ